MPVITQRDSGETFVLRRGSSATLQLSGRWVWSGPLVSSRAIELVQIFSFRATGSSEWDVVAERRGVAVIRAHGKPNCSDCRREPLNFAVTVVVRR
jgi:hypothetical protein